MALEITDKRLIEGISEFHTMHYSDKDKCEVSIIPSIEVQGEYVVIVRKVMTGEVVVHKLSNKDMAMALDERIRALRASAFAGNSDTINNLVQECQEAYEVKRHNIYKLEAITSTFRKTTLAQSLALNPQVL